MTPCYTFLGIFYLNNAEFTDGNFFDVFLSDSNDFLYEIDIFKELIIY